MEIDLTYFSNNAFLHLMNGTGIILKILEQCVNEKDNDQDLLSLASRLHVKCIVVTEVQQDLSAGHYRAMRCRLQDYDSQPHFLCNGQYGACGLPAGDSPHMPCAKNSQNTSMRWPPECRSLQWDVSTAKKQTKTPIRSLHSRGSWCRFRDDLSSWDVVSQLRCASHQASGLKAGIQLIIWYLKILNKVIISDILTPIFYSHVNWSTRRARD